VASNKQQINWEFKGNNWKTWKWTTPKPVRIDSATVAFLLQEDKDGTK